MTRLFRSACIAAVLMAGASATDARAATISIAAGETQSFDILWSKVVSGIDLTALGQFTVSVQNTFADFMITLTNNTSLASEKVHSIGFNTDPDGTSLSNPQSGTYFKNFQLSSNFPSFKRIDVCAWTTENCSGGGQGSNLPGLGVSDTFGFRLNGNFDNGLSLSTFAIKFQGDLGSFEFEGNRPPGTTVPEPSVLLLVGLGMATTFGARRAIEGRRRA